MRRVLLLCLVIVLLAVSGWAQELIRYTPPQLTSTGSGFLAPGAIILPDGTAALPSLAFLSSTGTGFSYIAANGIRISTNGVQRGYIDSAGVVAMPAFQASSTGTIGWSDVPLARDGAANILALKNGANNMTFRVYGSSGTTYLAVTEGGLQGGKPKSLTDAAAATAYATIAVPTNSQIAGELIWTAVSSAAAVRFVANGSIRFWGTDQAGTPVCGINKIGTDGEGHSSGAATLVCTWTNVVATTNCALSVTCTNSTAGDDPITLTGRLDMPTTATVTFN